MKEEPHAATGGSGLYLHAYRTSPSGMRLVPAPASRAWMNETTDRFANRCLPLKVANQAGWFVLNDRTVRVTWDGGNERSSVEVEFPGLEPTPAPGNTLASSHFGHGILTFHVPYLFRTPPGYNTLARGPANWPKDGACALEGLVETDWLVGSFTMNWKPTRPGLPVLFEEGEPICMVVPQRRGELEEFMPEVRNLEDDPETAYDYWRWAGSRWMFVAERERLASDGVPRSTINKWQKHYVRGTSPTGVSSEEHQTKLRLKPFEGQK